MNQEINLNGLIKGQVKIHKNKELVWDNPNGLVNNDYQLMLSKLLGGDYTYAINSIELFNGITSLAIANVIVDYPTVKKVRFISKFSPASFTGTITGAKLKSSTASTFFSSITGLSIVKTSTEEVTLSWTLELL